MVFREVVDALFERLKKCDLCPRRCGVNRLKGELGVCGVGSRPFISSAHLHFGEERVISGRRGSGTIFFSGCNLKCVFCQNFEISQMMFGREVEYDELAEAMLYLQIKLAHNINLVSPTHQLPQIWKALDIARDNGLRIPVVYNSGGYDSVEVLKLLDGTVEIYMPDFKYGSNESGLKYSKVPDYTTQAVKSLKEMYRQVGGLKIVNGIAVKGLLIRHLVLPDNSARTDLVLRYIADEMPDAGVNIMAQYYPTYKAYNYPELSRKLSPTEYLKWIEEADKLGLNLVD